MQRLSNGHRLRRGRHSSLGQIYLITAVTQGRTPVFNDFHNGRRLVQELRKADESGQVASLAWVIMPDHLHWLLQLEKDSLAALMCQVKSRSSASINAHRKHEGPLWQRGCHDRAVRKHEEIQACARYIIANPIRAGLVRKVGDYPLWDAVWV